jgi:hypothetical protein
MGFKVIPSEFFQKDFKRLWKKYPSLTTDVQKLGESLEDNPTQGQALGQNCYKIRLSISSKNQGKSGGARVITCVKIVDEIAYLIAIYDKSDMENISNDELKLRLKGIL